MTWIDLVTVAGLGLAGSGHCIGMCGGFALAVGRGAAGVGGLAARHAAWQAGKAATYVFLAILVAAGAGFLGRAGWFASVQSGLSIAAGVFMIAYGLGQAFEVRFGAWWQRVIEPLPGCAALAAVARAPGVGAAFFTGWLNGFIPCGLVVAMLLQVAGWHSVGAAAAGAAVFGLATFPGLFAFGLAGQLWDRRWRRVFVRVAGVLMIAFGVLAIVRAFPEGRAWIRKMRGLAPAPAAAPANAGTGCCGGG
jgi:hypothetical protein